MTKNVDLVTQVVPWGNTSWMINPALEDGVIGQIMARTTSPEDVGPTDVSIQVQLPNEWDSKLSAQNVGISAWVETDICNPEWIVNANKMTNLIVPSQHTKDVIDKTGGIARQVHVVPEAYMDAVGDDATPIIDLKLKTDFNFLLVGQITGNNPHNDRKNIFFTLKWMCECFANDPDVGIIVKTNSARGTSIDRMITEKTLRQVIGEIRKGTTPKVYLLHGNLDPWEMASLYRQPTVKALVNLTRGEGYGLPILEAAVSGLPVIATNWSGHLDFLSHGRFIPVNYRLTDIHSSRIDKRIFVPGARWAEADEKDAKKKLLKFRSRPETPQKWALELAPKVRKLYSQSAINDAYDNVLGSLLS